MKGCQSSNESGVSYDEEWNPKMIHSDENPNKKKGEDVKVAVMDSGIDYGIFPVEGYKNFVEDEANLCEWFQDMSGHGTSVAGVIHDVAPNAKIYSVKVLDSDNIASLSRVVEGIYWCIDNKMDIINMSFGTLTKSEVLQTAINDAKKAGIMMVASAGNGGTDGVEYPASCEGVMAVGAVDSNANKTDESAVGDNVDIVAPGQQVVSDGFFGSKVVVQEF